MLLLKVTSLLLLLPLLPLVLGLPKTRKEVDPRLMRLLLSNNFESGDMEPWYDESPGETHWVVENLDSPGEPTPAPQPDSGKNYIRVTRPDGYSSGLAVLYTPVWTANPGDKVSLSFWIRSRHTQGNTLDVYWINGTREEKLLGLSSYSTSSNFDWRNAEAVIPVSTPTNTQLVIYGYCGPNEEDSIAIDNIIVGQGNTTTTTVRTTTVQTTSSISFEPSTTDPSCSYELNGNTGTFTSPNYPSYYFDNLRCSWLITVDGSYYDGIRLYFTDFITEDNLDVVRVYGGPSTSSPLLLEHSGGYIPSEIYSYWSRTMLVTFTTDGSIVWNGFSAVYEGMRFDYTTEEPTTALPIPSPTADPYGCNRELVGYVSGSFYSPSYPHNYPDYLNCRWRITVPSYFQSVELQFNAFATEWSYDIVKVHDGPSESNPLLLVHSGSGLPATIYSTSTSIVVTFRSDGSNTNTGFSASFYGLSYSTKSRVQDDCGGHLSGSGYFVSPKDGSNSMDCYWYLESDLTSVQLFMEDFSTEINNNRVIVHDGWNTTDTILATWSGTCSSCSVRSSSSQMLVRVLSGGSGFKAHFNSTSS